MGATSTAITAREIELTVTRMRKIETALEPKFQEHSSTPWIFPNKVDAFQRLTEGGQIAGRFDGHRCGRRHRAAEQPARGRTAKTANDPVSLRR